jgi:hypothetical protein
MFRNIAIALALGAGAALPFAGAASASVADGVVGASAGSAQLLPLEHVQFFFGGQNYCFYPDGWHGPGFYWCGYGNRRGFGWGGPEGWRGWSGGGGGRPGFGGGHPGPRLGGAPRFHGGGGGARHGGGGHGGGHRP